MYITYLYDVHSAIHIFVPAALSFTDVFLSVLRWPARWTLFLFRQPATVHLFMSTLISVSLITILWLYKILLPLQYTWPTAIPKGSSWEDLRGPGLTWSNLWKIASPNKS